MKKQRLESKLIDNLNSSLIKRKKKLVSNRPERVAREIKSILSDIFIKSQIHDPVLFDKTVLISDVIMSKDLSLAKVYVFPWGTSGLKDQQLLTSLNKNIPFFRKQIVKSLRMKVIPNITFISDDQFDRLSDANDMFRLIEKK